jgi:hypothetical protein
MAWPGPGRAQLVMPPGSLWQPAEFTWRSQPVLRSLAAGGRRTGRVCAPKPPPPGISVVLSPARPMRTPCTRGVPGMLKGCSRFRRLYSPCTSGVLPLYTPCTRREWPRMRLIPSDPEELTRAVPATTTAPYSNRKQRISTGKSAGVVSGTPTEQQTHPAALVIDNGQVAGGIGARHDWAEELTATESIFPGTDRAWF